MHDIYMKKKMPVVAHLTSAHPRNDTRIFIKQCRSLAAHGYNVTLVVADDQGDDNKDGVRIVDVGHRPGRANRILKTTRHIFDMAVALNSDIFHIHDPELIPAGLKLKRLGKKVIFDSHEDIPRQILGKPYLGSMSRHMLSNTFALFERYACRRFDGIITATPFIRDKFLKINPTTVDVNNFPLIKEFENTARWAEKNDQVCYIGSISAMRGIREMVRACEFLKSPARLGIGGRFAESALESEVAGFPGWRRVDALGFLDRAAVRDVMARSKAGLVTLHPAINYLDALPIKMFEYMAAGIPVIASNFPLWRKIIEGNQCGLCVDQSDPKEIAAAIDYLIWNPEIAEQMGRNGHNAILNEYNWPTESDKLIGFYESL